jgi:hypothetical protein
MAGSIAIDGASPVSMRSPIGRPISVRTNRARRRDPGPAAGRRRVDDPGAVVLVISAVLAAHGAPVWRAAAGRGLGVSLPLVWPSS